MASGRNPLLTFLVGAAAPPDCGDIGYRGRGGGDI